MSQILLIEPNTLLAEMYRQALEHAGHTVAWASGAQAGIEAADTQTPDMVVLELQLPLHNGLEFLHEFRSYSEWVGIPVIAHTGLSTVRETRVSEVLHHDLGVRAILYKPHTSLQDLVRTVREHRPPTQ